MYFIVKTIIFIIYLDHFAWKIMFFLFFTCLMSGSLIQQYQYFLVWLEGPNPIIYHLLFDELVNKAFYWSKFHFVFLTLNLLKSAVYVACKHALSMSREDI